VRCYNRGWTHKGAANAYAMGRGCLTRGSSDSYESQADKYDTGNQWRHWFATWCNIELSHTYSSTTQYVERLVASQPHGWIGGSTQRCNWQNEMPGHTGEALPPTGGSFVRTNPVFLIYLVLNQR
jgi:hypothetical protein